MSTSSIARSNDCRIQIRRHSDETNSSIFAGLGIGFLANMVQTFGTNWLGQICRYPGPCFHMEWLAMGIPLSAAVYFVWKLVDRRRR
jgi:hypothetical protein